CRSSTRSSTSRWRSAGTRGWRTWMGGSSWGGDSRMPASGRRHDTEGRAARLVRSRTSSLIARVPSPMTPVDRVRTRLTSIVGRGLPISLGLILVVSIAAGVLAFVYLNSAPPTTLTMTSGPDGSSFRKVAEQYRTILAREGVTVNILASQGSHDNLARLADRK